LRTRFLRKEVLCVVAPPSFRDVLERDQQRGAVAGLREPAGADQQGALSDARERAGDLAAHDRARLRDDPVQERPELVHVPLAVAEIEQASAQDIFPVEPEGPAKGGVRVQDMKAAVEHQQRQLDRLDNGLGLRLAGAQQAIEVVLPLGTSSAYRDSRSKSSSTATISRPMRASPLAAEPA
jgi:hypothetical protein